VPSHFASFPVLRLLVLPSRRACSVHRDYFWDLQAANCFGAVSLRLLLMLRRSNCPCTSFCRVGDNIWADHCDLSISYTGAIFQSCALLRSSSSLENLLDAVRDGNVAEEPLVAVTAAIAEGRALPASFGLLGFALGLRCRR
jgi:hypothetical protein